MRSLDLGKLQPRIVEGLGPICARGGLVIGIWEFLDHRQGELSNMLNLQSLPSQVEFKDVFLKLGHVRDPLIVGVLGFEKIQQGLCFSGVFWLSNTSNGGEGLRG